MMHHSQLLKHRCAWPGCAKLVPLSMWGCRAHWYSLPHGIRMNLTLAYQRGIDDDTHPTPNYIEACRQAREWIAKQPAPAYSFEGEAQGKNDARRDLP